MKHVHAEVIKAWAEDTSVEIEFDVGSGWLTATAQPQFWEHCNLRIKPQPKAISWITVYKNGVAGSSHSSKEEAEVKRMPGIKVISILEVRDDGTAHLHKVEA